MQPFAVFTNKENDFGPSRLARKLLAVAETAQAEPPLPAALPHAPSRRPPSAQTQGGGAGAKKVSRQSSRSKASAGRDVSNHPSREDLAVELQEVKRRLAGSEETIHALKGENQRLETEATRQQRRIEQLLHLSEGVRGGAAQGVRREIEKSLLVRQLKAQVTALRNLVAEKDLEIDQLRRDIRTSHVKEVEVQCEEYSAEIQRLVRTVDDLKEELFRERQRREWNSKLAGETGEELRRELARLAANYQHMLTNINARSAPRPASASSSGIRSERSDRNNRPRSASRQQLLEGDLLENFNLDAVNSAELLGSLSAQNQGVERSAALQVGRDLMQDESPQNSQQQQQQVERTLSRSNSGGSQLSQHGDLGRHGEAAAQPALVHLHRPHPQRPFPVAQDFIPVSQQVEGHVAQAADPSQVVLPEVAFPLGSRVEARYYNGTTWYQAVVKAASYSDVKQAFIYEVLYDDGEREKAVLESNLRIPSSVTAAPPSSAEDRPVSAAGQPQAQGALAKPSPQPVTVKEEVEEEAQVKVDFPVGSRVQGRFDDGNWYGGQVTAVVREGKEVLYDLRYDDGDEGRRMAANRVRGVPLPPATSSTTKYKAGDRVEGRFSDGKWYLARVRAVRSNESGGAVFDLDFEDGDHASDLSEDHLRPLPLTTQPAESQPQAQGALAKPSPQPVTVKEEVEEEAQVKVDFPVGSRVQGRFDDGNWYGGQVTAVVREGKEVLYDLRYDDGDEGRRMAANRVRGVPLPPATSSTTKYKAGDRIQSYFEAVDRWYDGTVKAANSDQTYAIDYDDGDKEGAVESSRLRPLQAQLASPVPTSVALYHVGDVVEARYQAGSQWFPGRVRDAHTSTAGTWSYHIVYDDGDEELQVTEDCLRKVAPKEQPHAPAVVTTNLDAFLNELSDDDDEGGAAEGVAGDAGGGGGLDAGPAVTLLSGGTRPVTTSSPSEEDYEEDFAA
eukprot:gene9839-10883_t